MSFPVDSGLPGTAKRGDELYLRFSSRNSQYLPNSGVRLTSYAELRFWRALRNGINTNRCDDMPPTAQFPTGAHRANRESSRRSTNPLRGRWAMLESSILGRSFLMWVEGAVLFICNGLRGTPLRPFVPFRPFRVQFWEQFGYRF